MIRRGALLCATMVVSGLPLHAQSVRTGIDVSAEAEVTRNPYLDETDSDWVGAGVVEVRPWLVSETATNRVELEAFARGRAFTGEYAFEDSFGGSLRASSRLTERTQLFGVASVLSTSARSNFSRFARSGFGFAFDPLAPFAPANPDTPVLPGEPASPIGPGFVPVIVSPIDDITIVGLRGRSTTYSLSAGVNHALDTVSSITASVGYNRLDVEEDAISGYDSVVANVGYSRRLSARTTAGLSLSAGRTEYDGALPTTTTLGAYANVQHQFDDAWSLNASVGVSNARSDASGPNPAVNDTGLVGNLAACRSNAQSRLCLGVSRAQMPSTLGQVRVSDTVDLSYSARLSARDRLDLNANYGRSLAPDDFDPVIDDVEIASIGGTYTRSFSQRLEGYAFGRASRSWGGLLGDEPSLSFGIGIRARFGDQR